MPVERAPGGTSLIDVLDRVLDKGIIIDAWVRVSLVGIDLVTVEARVVVASIDTYLRYADALGLMQSRPGMIETGTGSLVAAPLRSTTDRAMGQDGKRKPAPGWEGRGEWAGVVLLSRATGVTATDLDALVPFAREAGEVLSYRRDVAMLQETSEAHAIEKEWLWWMANGVGDALLITDSNNDIILQNRRAELLFRATDEDSAGKRRAVWMNNFLFTA